MGHFKFFPELSLGFWKGVLSFKLLLIVTEAPLTFSWQRNTYMRRQERWGLRACAACKMVDVWNLSSSPCLPFRGPALLHPQSSLQEPYHPFPEAPGHPGGKIGFQKHIYQRYIPSTQHKSRPSQLMERVLLRPQSPAWGNLEDPLEPADLLTYAEGLLQRGHLAQLPEPTAMVTVEVLDLKLHTLL